MLSVFSSSKCSLFHNSNVFGSCNIQFYIQNVLKLKYNSCAKVYCMEFFLYNIRGWFCITEIQTVYCAVRTKS